MGWAVQKLWLWLLRTPSCRFSSCKFWAHLHALLQVCYCSDSLASNHTPGPHGFPQATGLSPTGLVCPCALCCAGCSCTSASMGATLGLPPCQPAASLPLCGSAMTCACTTTNPWQQPAALLPQCCRCTSLTLGSTARSVAAGDVQGQLRCSIGSCCTSSTCLMWSGRPGDACITGGSHVTRAACAAATC